MKMGPSVPQVADVRLGGSGKDSFLLQHIKNAILTTAAAMPPSPSGSVRVKFYFNLCAH